MRLIVRCFDRLSMRLYNGSAQVKPKSQTAAAVCLLLFPCVKQVEYIWLVLILNSRTIIGNADHDMVPFQPVRDPDRCPGRRMLHRI